MPRRTHIDPRNIEVIDDVMAQVYRQKSGAEKLKIADSCFRFAREIALAGIRSRHPHWDETTARRALAQRLLASGTGPSEE
jgi:hypothetical protein